MQNKSSKGTCCTANEKWTREYKKYYDPSDNVCHWGQTAPKTM